MRGWDLNPGSLVSARTPSGHVLPSEGSQVIVSRTNMQLAPTVVQGAREVVGVRCVSCPLEGGWLACCVDEDCDCPMREFSDGSGDVSAVAEGGSTGSPRSADLGGMACMCSV